LTVSQYIPFLLLIISGIFVIGTEN
jgi:hypothetical protein